MFVDAKRLPCPCCGKKDQITVEDVPYKTLWRRLSIGWEPKKSNYDTSKEM